MCVYIYIYTYVCMYIYVYTYINTHTHIFFFLHYMDNKQSKEAQDWVCKDSSDFWLIPKDLAQGGNCKDLVFCYVFTAQTPVSKLQRAN